VAAKLDGVRILDISRVLSGPYCTMTLADLGAEVIKVEPPGGNETRTWPPFYSNGESGYYLALNRNKKGMVLDLKHPEGKKVLFDLAKKSDVVIENFTPGVVKRLGIDYDAMKAVNSMIIYCSISGFGQTGPYRKKKAYDPVIQAMGGAMSLTGVRDGEPVKIGIPVGDLGGSMMAVTSILAALFARETQRVGDFIDISMLDGQIAMLSIMAAEYFAEGKLPGRWGLEHPWRVPSKTFQTKNGYITSSATSSNMYPTLCKILGLEQLIDDPRFKTNADRVNNRDQIYPLIEAVMRTKTSEEWEKLFEAAGLPSGIMYTLDQVFNDPHVLERKMLEVIDHPTIGKLKMIGVPVKYGSDGTKKMTAPPMLGEHTDEILRRVLGYDEGEIARMRREKVVS
jgi:crotonobetainyl-CoA:carnitine CoA-transferase CaiB-like acyl-CoA transferase